MPLRSADLHSPHTADPEAPVVLRFPAVEIGANVGGNDLDDPSLAPVWDAAAALGRWRGRVEEIEEPGGFARVLGRADVIVDALLGTGVSGAARGPMAAAIDAKDPYTRGHSERVSNFAEKIAAELGLPEREVEVVRISALMHDVGKIGIEDKILGKEGPLTDDEYEIMKTHPVKGAVIMEQVPQLKEMIPGMKYHHENVNGTGYPEGLRGDEIPLTAKIVSVADCFDAMTTNRPYQKAMDIGYVLERMRSFVGKKFDREVVEALIKAYEEGLIRPNMPTRQMVSFVGSKEKTPAVVASEHRR